MYFNQFFYLTLVFIAFKNIKVRIPIKLGQSNILTLSSNINLMVDKNYSLNFAGKLGINTKKNQKIRKQIKSFQHTKTFNSNHGSVILSRVNVPVLSDIIWKCNCLGVYVQ